MTNPVLRRSGINLVSFFCPGCNTTHQVRISGDNPWKWNASYISPTLEPSILTTGGHFAEGWEKGNSCWCTFKEKHPEVDTFSCNRCHCYVTDGKIQYLDDCSHDLRGQTIDMIPGPLPHSN